MIVDYLPFAINGGALVDLQATYAASGYQQNGMQVGLAQPSQANKVWRQSSMIAAAVANVISLALGINVLDDGNLAGLITNLQNALMKSADKPVLVPINGGAPIFDCSVGNVFELVLTQNCALPTIVNFTPGQRLTMILREDAVGGRTFAPPAALPMADITTTPNTANVQEFVVRQDGTIIYPRTPMVNFP